LLREKSESLDCFKELKTAIELKFNAKIKCVHSDKDGEFYGRHDEIGRNLGPFARFLQECGIEVYHANLLLANGSLRPRVMPMENWECTRSDLLQKDIIKGKVWTIKRFFLLFLLKINFIL